MRINGEIDGFDEICHSINDVLSGAPAAALAMGVTEALGGLLADNPYFGAGFGLFGVGMAAAAAKRGSAVAM